MAPRELVGLPIIRQRLFPWRFVEPQAKMCSLWLTRLMQDLYFRNRLLRLGT